LTTRRYIKIDQLWPYIYSTNTLTDVQNNEFQFRQWTDLIVFLTHWRSIHRVRRAVAADSNHAVESAGSDPAGEESGGSVAAARRTSRVPADDEGAVV
jgi:hypothetical protein